MDFAQQALAIIPVLSNTESGLALASSQVANGYLVSPLATEQRAGVAKLATRVFRSVWQVKF